MAKLLAELQDVMLNNMENIEQKSGEKNKLLPSYYYYTDSGLMVFTEEYHKQRGYCCGNGCKHCPFDPPYQKRNTTVKK